MGLTFVRKISASLINSLTISAPFSLLVFIVIPFLPLLSRLKIGFPIISNLDFVPSKNDLIGQPVNGSTLITSAPQSLSIPPAPGAATYVDISITFNPSSIIIPHVHKNK